MKNILAKCRGGGGVGVDCVEIWLVIVGEVFWWVIGFCLVSVLDVVLGCGEAGVWVLFVGLGLWWVYGV